VWVASRAEATSLDTENLCFGKSQCSAIRLADEKTGYIEFQTLDKHSWLYLRNIKTAINYCFYKWCAHNLPIFLIGKIWLNIGICQTLGFSILKMSLRACRALSVTKLSLYAIFCNAITLSLFIFKFVTFCNGLRCNGGIPKRVKTIPSGSRRRDPDPDPGVN
jgi:hypothetical protein